MSGQYYPDSDPVPLQESKHSSHLLAINLFVIGILLVGLVLYGVMGGESQEENNQEHQVAEEPEEDIEYTKEEIQELKVEPEVCGNNVCDPSESADTCPQDCADIVVCGDNVCDESEQDESLKTYCAPDCDPEIDLPELAPELPKEEIQELKVEPEVCGNGVCDPSETLLSCEQDCSNRVVCGDNICAEVESNKNNQLYCETDCGGN